MNARGAGFPALAIGLFLSAVVLGLSLVWLNTESIYTAYEFKKLSTRVEESENLLAKLTIERDNLLAPYRLRALAREYGLGPAESGQIRRLSR